LFVVVVETAEKGHDGDSGDEELTTRTGEREEEEDHEARIHPE